VKRYAVTSTTGATTFIDAYHFDDDGEWVAFYAYPHRDPPTDLPAGVSSADQLPTEVARFYSLNTFSIITL
jgi:hypothetical protein